MITEVRGKGLFIGIELNEPARPYCEQLKAAGLLCKETHENVIRIAPPLVISEEELEWAFQKLKLYYRNDREVVRHVGTTSFFIFIYIKMKL